MKFGFWFCLIFFSVVSCGRKCDYPHLKELENYLTLEIDYSIREKEVILILLPLDACDACLKGTLAMLTESGGSFDIIVCYSGYPEFSKLQLTQSVPESRIFYDKKGNCKMYEIGTSVPLIFHFKNGKCLFFSETTENRHTEIKRYFEWN
jgi:hypothetical protein